MKRVLVTGASSGIGEATAKYFSEKKYEVTLLGRDTDKLKKVSASLPHPSSFHSVDLLDEAAILDFTAQQKKPFHTVVHNAGTFHINPFLKTEASVWKEQFQIHIMACVHLLQNLKIEESVVNVSSTCGLSVVENTSAYSVMKASLITLTEHLAVEWAPSVRVNCICPGIVDTPIHSFHSSQEAEKKSFHSLQPMKRMGSAHEIAEAIFFLATSSWMTGSVLALDGGIRLSTNSPAVD